MSSHEHDLISNVLNDRARLPSLVRPAHRILTGIPNIDENPKPTTPIKEFVRDVCWLATTVSTAGIATWIASNADGITTTITSGLVASIGVLGTIGRLRRLVVGHVHEASHGTATGFYVDQGYTARSAARATAIILTAGTALTLTMNGEAYRQTHGRHHRLNLLGTLGDPDGQMLHDWGVWPSQSPSLGVTLLRKIVDPRWHWQFLKERLASSLGQGRLHQRAIGLAVAAVLLASSFLLPLQVWIAAVFIPWGPGYNIAALLQIVTEHPYGSSAGARSFDEYVARTWERIPYAPMPSSRLLEDPKAWMRWTLKILGHCLARLAILDESMIAHGYHHLAWPLGRRFNDWWNTTHHFMRARAEGALPPKAETRVLQGLTAALRRQSAYFRAVRSTTSIGPTATSNSE